MPKYKKRIKNILVTGGAGFIGSHLVKALIKKNFNVYVLDDFSTGRIENLKEVLHSKLLHITRGSITDEVLLSKAIEDCDFVYHLAATVGLKNVVEKPLATLIYDTFGTELVLKYASSKGIKVVLTSTSAVYGKARKFPLKENADAVIGSPYIYWWCYAASKLVDEFLAISYHRERKLPVVIVRLFNVVGPGQVGHYGMVFPRFFKRALANKPMHVYGDGKQTRCFAYIDDVIELLVRVANCKKVEGDIINLGTNNEVTIKDLAQKIKKAAKSSSRIVMEPYENYYGKHFEDIKRRVPDLNKLKRVIGKVPKTGIDEIIRKMKLYYDRHPEELEKI